MMNEDMMERHMAGLRGLSAPFGPEVEKWCEDSWGVSDRPVQGASYIMHDGKFLRVGELSSPYRRDDSAIHADVERDILMNCPFVDPAGFGYPGLRSGEGAEGLELPEPFILDWLGCIRLNSDEDYIDLPAERPNSRMQSALALWLDGFPDSGSIEVNCWNSTGGEAIGITRIGLNGSLDPEKAVRSLMSYYSLGYVRESLGRGGGAESVLKPCLRRMNRPMEGTGRRCVKAEGYGFPAAVDCRLTDRFTERNGDSFGDARCHVMKTPAHEAGHGFRDLPSGDGKGPVSPAGRYSDESLKRPKASDADILAKAVGHFGVLSRPNGMKGYVLPDGRFMSLVSPDNDRGLDPDAMDRDTYTDYARHDNVSYWLDRVTGMVPGDYDETEDGSSFMERMGCVRCGGPRLPYIVLPAGRPSDSALRTLTGWIQDCSDQRDGNLLYVYAGKSQHLYRFADYTAGEIASKISAYYGTGLLGESCSRAGTKANVGYRYEGLYGSGVRSLRDIVTYEVLELGNDDILDTVLGSFAMAPSDRKTVQDALDGKGSRGEAVKACLRAIRREYPNAKYALWLCDSPEDVVSSYSEDGDGGEQISRDDIDAYPKGLPKPISDLGQEGKLWLYNDMPEPV